MKILGIIQARVSSSRLPGKVLKPLLGVPMILRQIERLKACRQIDEWVVATSDHASDDVLEGLLRKEGVSVFRGSLEDVLDRFYQASIVYRADHIVRLTADCPLIDPGVVDQVVAVHLQEANDYTSNVMPPTFPDGLDVEILSGAILQQIWQEADLPSQREHVTLFIRQQAEHFKLGRVKAPSDFSAMRWTVDEKADLAFVETVYERLYSDNPYFGFAEVVDLMTQEPSLAKLNDQYQRNEGLIASLKKDKDLNL